MQNQVQHISLLIGDIFGFSELMTDDADRALSLLEKYQEAIDSQLNRYDGQLQQNYFGKACVLRFAKPEAALHCAHALQQVFKKDPLLRVPLLITKNDPPENFFFGSYVENILVSAAVMKKTSNRSDYTWQSFSADDFSWDGELFSVSQKVINKPSLFGSKNKNLLLLAGIISVLIICVAFLSAPLILTKTSPQESAIQSTKKSIAVLPFTNLNAASQSFFADGVMEDILTHLAKFKDLKVISRTSSMQYKSTDKSVPEIASELGVDYLLEGSVQQWEDRVKLTVQLVKAKEDEHVWAETYERTLQDLFAIQSEVSKKIAITLNQSISPELSLNINRRPTENMAAYNALLESRELNRIRTKASMEESLRRLDYALQLDPDFAAALANKAATIAVMSSLGYHDDPVASNEQAEQLALQAIKLDPKNDIAYATLGNLYFDAQKWKQSETSFQIAIQHNPNNALANYWYSLKLRYLGRLEEAIHYGSIAADLDPLYPVIQTGHALTCMMGDQMDLAKAILDKGQLIFENYFGYYWVRAYYKMAHGQYKEAIIDFTKSQELSPAITSIQRQIMYCKARLGQVEEVELYINSQTKEDIASYINLASAYAGMGKKQESIACIRKAWNMGGFSTGVMYNVKFKGLLEEPDYQALLEEMKQKEKLVQ